MAITITVGGVDVTEQVPFLGGIYGLPALEIRSDATSLCSQATVPVVDDANVSLTIAEKAAVVIADGATTYFSGYVASIDAAPVWADTVSYVLKCQDKNIRLEETVVESESYNVPLPEPGVLLGDDEIIDDLFTTYLPEVDSSTYVAQLDAELEPVYFVGKTLRQCMTMICELTGGRFYVDQAGYLHYFASESNAAAWDLSDSPNMSTTYPYDNLKKRVDATVIIDEVLVIGNGVSGTVGSGTHQAVVYDESITTSQGITDRGNAIITEYASGQTTYTCTIRKAGLAAGMDIDLTNALLGLSAETLTIRRITMKPTSDDGSECEYDLELGDEILVGEQAARTISDRLDRTAGQVSEISDDVFDADAPSAPTFSAGNVTTGVIEDADGHQIVWIRATWGEVTDADLDHYEVQLADNTSFNWPMVGLIRAGETREYQWNGLRGNISYYARVRAVDWCGNYSDWSPASPGYLSVTSSADSSAPAQVTGAAAAGARTMIGVTWSDSTEADLSHYEIQSSANGSTGWTTRDYPRRTMFLDQDFTEAQIQAGTARYYRIRAVDTSGNAGDWSSTVNASTSAIGSDTIAAGAIITDKLAANAVTAGKIAANAVDTDQLTAGAVTATKCDISTLSAITADMGTLTAGEIRVGTGTVGSNFTGFRIMSSYIGGYNTDTLQAGIRSSDGKFIAGAGNVTLDADGVSLAYGTNAVNKIKWVYSTTAFGTINGYADASNGVLRLSGLNTGSGYGEVELIGSSSSEGTAAKWQVISTSTRAQLLDVSDGVCVRFDGRKCYINDTANANLTYGLTINQGANDDEIVALKSSDVGHGATTLTETDTFGLLAKCSADNGGLTVRGFRDGGSYKATEIYGALAANIDTTKSTSGHAIVEVYATQISGTGVADVVADGNVFAIKCRRGSADVTVLIVDEDGNLLTDDTASTYDAEDDVALVREMAELLAMDRSERTDHLRRPADRKRAEALGIVHADDNGVMVSHKRQAALLRGALLQLEKRVVKLEAMEAARRGDRKGL